MKRELVITFNTDALLARRAAESLPSIADLLRGIPHTTVSGDARASLAIVISEKDYERVLAAVQTSCVVDEEYAFELLSKSPRASELRG